MYRVRFVAPSVILGLMMVVGQPAMADPCVSGNVDANPITVENCLPGSPSSVWDISGAGDDTLQGFATDISVNRGDTVRFKINTSAPGYRIDIYRLGYYQGNGARKITTVAPTVAPPQSQPACLTDPGTLLTDCGNWSESAFWSVPLDAVSGIYLARLVRTDDGGASHIAFIVRDDASTSDLLFKTSDTTWQAYNTWGGYSLYVGVARRVSYNRPFYTRASPTEDWLFNAEYPMVRWLEANGYDVTYTTDVDTDKYAATGPNRILAHKLFLSVGHDEYWSAGERAAVEEAREAGVNLAFFSGNEVYWKIRWEPSIDTSATPHRTLVCYKEGTAGENTCGSRCDPNTGNVWTGLWRAGCEYPALDGCRPENALSGNISWVGSTSLIQVPQTYGGLRFWRNTTIASLPAGQIASLTGGTLGYEWDFEQYRESYPPGRILMSETTLGGQTHHLSLYRHYSSGVRKGLVFGAGTVQWSWGLDGNHDRGASTPDPRMQQATVNLFADMGAQPSSLQSPLYAAAASTDLTAPTSSIDSPLGGSTVQINVPITISGLATDTGGVVGVVGVVEVSVDGGTTWRPASGRETWSITWTPTAYGTATLKSRAADDSGNIEVPGSGVTVTVGDTPSGPPNVPVANSDYYTTDRNVPLTVAAPGVLSNDTDPNSDPISAVLRSTTTHGALTLNADGSFAYMPATDWAGNDSFTYRAKDPSDNMSASANVTIGVSQTCPCTIFLPTSEPVSPRESDPNALEVGVRFKSDVGGYITAIRFYKHAQNSGNHTAHLWTAGGTLLATEPFIGESASGWQEVILATPVQITAGSTYIASYHSTTGYAQDTNVFSGSGVDNPPLHALGDGIAGPNGVYTYCAAPGCFPSQGYLSSNYYVDLVFALSIGADVTAPTVTTVTPARSATGVLAGSNVTATFSESMNPMTIDDTTFELRDAGDNLVPASISYSVAARQAILDPSASLAFSATYTATIKGGTADPRVKDLAGNALAANDSWSFTTGSAPPPGPDEGPGGPILVVASSANPFGRYFAEILRTEGLNYFTVTDIQNVTPALLAGYRSVILGEMSLSGAQVTMLTDWVTGGGRLIAMRPDKQLAGLFGLTDASTTLAEKYLLIDTAVAPGAGLVNQTIQFHGTADLYTLSGATVLATLYSNATTSTTYPAVTLRSVGNGVAAAFTYDLAKSVVYTRQGNPAWIGQDRDGRGPRAQDMFYGNASGDPQPDWIDLTKVAIPQADEQQRLLAKLLQHVDSMPLPRFWYFPRMKKAVVIMTGDDEASGTTASRWDRYIAQSPTGCSVADWECIRGSSYIIGITGTDAQALYYTNLGFELAVHVNTGCAGWTPSQLESYYSTQLAAFQAAFPSIPPPASERTHCIAWSDWDTNAHVQATHGIRLDTNYYYWPPDWVANRPGYFTGSGMLMRFADVDGTMVDNYQSATQIPDESGLSLPAAFDAMIAKALGPEGYYGAIDANMHTTSAVHSGSDAIVASALLNGIPVVSGRQMAEWLDGRNGSKFGDFSWNGNVLSFSVTAAAGARNLKGMVPRMSSVGAFTGLTRGGAPIATTTETIKGVEYAIFDATTGAYAASYAVDTTPPVITNVNAAPGFGGTAVITWDTSTEASDSRVNYGTAPGSLAGSATSSALVTSHSITLTGLLPNATYYYKVTSKDSLNNAATYPPADPPLSFTTPSAAFQETTVLDFGAGTTGSCTYVSETTNGEVILAPTEGAEFSGTTIPTGWTVTPWVTGGTGTVSGGKITLSAALVRTNASYPAGRAVEFVATFSGAANQHAGFGIDFTQSAWAIFSTMGGGGLWARSNGSPVSETAIPGSWLNAPHRFRIEWTPSTVKYFIDGVEKASHVVTFGSNMGGVASDYVSDGGDLVVDWMRMSPYPASCSYTSRLFNAGGMAAWGAMSWTAATPSGTSLAMYVRLGDALVPDGTWTGWTQVSSSGSTIGGQSQYLQYRADLATADSGVTPALEDVAFGYSLGPDTTPPTITGRSPAPGATAVPATTNVVVQFSEPIDAATVNGDAVTLHDIATGLPVPAAVTCSGGAVTLDPSAALTPGRQYRVDVAATIADLAHNPLGALDTWTFTVYLDTAPPTIAGRTPAPGATSVAVNSNVTVQFSEEMNPATLDASTVRLRATGAGSDVAAVVTYAGLVATLDPVGSLLEGQSYGVTVSGLVTDLAGHALGADDTWSFTTVDPPPPLPTEGPGGPILVISSASNPFSRYFVEILRAEGLNEFFAMDLSQVTPSILANYDVVILGEMPLTTAQVTMLTDWTNAGGTLVAMRPDPQLAGLLGVTPAGGTLADKYLLVNTASGPGVGIVGQTIQFHGTADLYTLSGATAVATLYSSATTATTNPAVTTRAVGANGGKAIAFTFDLARSVVYTRQGNPAWAGQKRDGQIEPIRPDDQFYGNASFDPQPDWIDLDKVAIPQADEQQRLLANAILLGNLHRKPLPRFWYLPKGLKAAIVETGDDHGDGGMACRFEIYRNASPANCSVDDWECVRATGYEYTGPGFTDAQAVFYNDLGFEVALHINTNCGRATQSQYEAFTSSQLASFTAAFPSIPAPSTNRNHCIAWSDWSSVPEVEAAHGIRLDTNYYYWPPSWVQNRSGMFTGSGFPMRFAKLDGTLIDTYQASTEMPDESGESFPAFCNQLLDRANGPEGYYGVFTTNMHFDSCPHASSNAIVASAQARGVPVVSAKQMLTWLDGRNGSSFGGLTWSGNTLSFSVVAAAGSRNLQAMVPLTSAVGPFSGITRNGAPVAYTTQTVKGIQYAFFPATAGNYVADYSPDTTPPVITAVAAAAHDDGTATITWTTDEASDSRVDYGMAQGSLTLNASDASLLTGHTVTLTGLAPSTIYYYRVTSKDAASNSVTEPVLANNPLSFVTPAPVCFRDQTTSDFAGGTTGTGTSVVTITDGEVTLRPVLAAEFTVLPPTSEWQSFAWATGGTSTVSGGLLTVDGARFNTEPVTTTYGPGSSVEFMATFNAVRLQHIGFAGGDDGIVAGGLFNSAPWAIFSTGGGTQVQARVNVGGTLIDFNVPLSLLGTAHKYRIDWKTASVDFYVDDALVHTETVTVPGPMRVAISDLDLAGLALSVDWIRIAQYAASGTFTSRVYDGGASTTWDQMSWTAGVPAGTSLRMFAHQGNTASPDGSWTAYAEVPSSGMSVGGSSRYIQYRADLATTIPSSTPVLQDVHISCNAAPDLTPPVISNVTATPGSGATAVIGWNTDELATSRVDYGTSPDALNLTATSASLVGTHALTLTGLASNATYYYRVTSVDAASNSATSPNPPVAPLSFVSLSTPLITNVAATSAGDGLSASVTWTTDVPATSRVDYGTSAGSLTQNVSSGALVTSHGLTLPGLAPATTYYYRVTSVDAFANSSTQPIPPATATVITQAPVCAVDVTSADFAGGTTGSTTYISDTAGGEVILAPVAGAEFTGTALPAGWQSGTWVSGGTATVGGGLLTVDGAHASTTASFGPGRSLEFVATFQAANYQNVGFAADGLFTAPWVTIGLGGTTGGVYARREDGADVLLSASALGSPHRYRIDWNASTFVFYVDGVLVTTMTKTVATNMVAIVSDYNLGGPVVTVDWLRVTPYTASGSYTSRVFDSGGTTTWGAASWTSSLPVGTSLAMFARRGGTPVPDGSWTAFIAIPTSGSSISGTGRFLQYRADLATADVTVTPELRDVTIQCLSTPDVTPPVIASVVATPAGDGLSANVTWTTDELANSRVDYGTSAGSLNLNVSNASFVLSHSVTLSGLSPATTHYYRVTSADANSNSATSPVPPATASFFTPAPCPSDQTAANFGLGTLDANTAISLVGDGEVILKPTSGTEFSGPGLPGDWQSAAWSGGSTPTVSGGLLTLTGGHAATTATFGPGRSIEFMATFRAKANQHIGFTADFAFNSPWAIFSTFGTTTGIYARVNSPGGSTDTLISSSLLGSPHRYRIDWNSTSFAFYVDGTLATTITRTISTSMLAHASDLTGGGLSLTLDWLRVTPYAASGTFTSRIFDQGGPANWGVATWTSSTPIGTSLSVLARTGNTAPPDGTWSSYFPLANGLSVGANSRYIQYRADLATTVLGWTPELQGFAIACAPGPDVTAPSITNVAAVSASNGQSATVSWTTDEFSDSRVDYGTSSGALTSSASNASLVKSHSLTLTGLHPGVTYYYRVTSADAVPNSATSPNPPASPLSFTTLTPICAVDQTAAHFGLGSTGTNTYVSVTTDGEVILAPTLANEFSGTSLPSDWTSVLWSNGTAGGSTFPAGSVSVDGGRLTPTDTTGYGAGRVLEFVATFAAATANQHIGFGSGDNTTGGMFNNNPASWAMFSTKDGAQLRARMNIANTATDVDLGTSYLGGAHRYRIEWTSTSVVWLIDGAVVRTATSAPTVAMRPGASDFTAGGAVLNIDWIRMSPYAPLGVPVGSGTFDSRIHDGLAAVSWKDITWNSTLPASTSASISVRTGNTATPDGTWTAFAPIAASGNQVGQVGRYLQYRASLSTTNPDQTPALLDLSVRCGAPPECTVDANCDDGNSCTTDTCDGGFCSHAVKTNGTSCSDGNACNGLETCQAGICTAGTPLDCNDGDACTTDSCNPATGCQHTAICTVSGTVYYYRDNTLSEGAGGEPSLKGVENVGIGAIAVGPALATTGGTGAYVIPGLHGNVTITSVNKYGDPRASDHRGAITSMDAARLAMAAVGNGSLSVNQKFAGDVTGNGTTSALDASLVARFAVGLVDHFPVATTTASASDWKFLRCGLSYPLDCVDPIYAFNPVTPAETGKDLYAILYGDVTGNWPQVEALAAAEAGGGSSASKPAEPLSPLSTVLSMPDTAGGGPGSTVFVPISATPGDGILGIDMTIQFDPAVVSATSVTTAGIATGFGIAANLTTPGVALISLFATSLPMAGSGEIARIEFHVAGAPGATSALTFTRASINEGSIPRVLDPGLFTVTCAGVANGTACNDGNACTTADHCSAGVCTGTAVTAPAEVAGVSFLSDRATIAWNASADVGAVYDVVRGHLATLPVGPGGGDELCAANDLTTTTFTDTEPVAPGDGLWYLVRAANSCAIGTYGYEGRHGVPMVQRFTTTCQ